jgi:GNAT superfamily N-acetyltransferase
MNDCVRLIRHSDRAWHDRFFNFDASILKSGGRTFFTWGARGDWVDGYDVFAVVVDDQIVSTVGRASMRYVINGEARKGYQLGAVATHADHRNRGLARLLTSKVLGELDAPDPRVRAGLARCRIGVPPARKAKKSPSTPKLLLWTVLSRA